MARLQNTQSLIRLGVSPSPDRQRFWLGRPLRVSGFGNSIVQGGGRNIIDAAVRTSGLFQLAPNYGVGGENSTQMVARMSAVVGCDMVLILEGPNDAGAGATVRTHFDNYRIMIEHFLGRGILPAVVAATPRNASPGIIEAYRWAEMLLCAEYGIPFYDPWIELVEPTTGAWLTGISDGIHPNDAASDTAIVALRSLLIGATFTELFVPRASVADASDYLISGGNQLLTDNSGTTPNVAFTGWTKSGGTPPTYDVIDAPTGHRGKFIQMTSNSASGGTPLIFRRITGKHQAGDEILVSLACAFPNFVSGATASVTLAGGGGISGGPGGAGELTKTLTYSHALARYVGVLKTTTSDLIELRVSLGNTGIGSILQVGEVEIANLTKMLSR